MVWSGLLWPQFDLKQRLNCIKKKKIHKGLGEKKGNASEAAANTKPMSAQKVLLGSASSLLRSVAFLTYLSSDTAIRTTEKQSLIYNSAITNSIYYSCSVLFKVSLLLLERNTKSIFVFPTVLRSLI